MIIDDIDFAVDVSIEVTTALHKTLAGHPPGVQSSAIMQLFARLVAAYPPRAREPLIKLFVREGRRLVPLIEHEMFGDAGHPDRYCGACHKFWGEGDRDKADERD